MPDPIWWLAGDNAAVRAFMTLFMERLEYFMHDAGFAGQEKEEQKK